MQEHRDAIEQGNTILGIELGSTRIKMVLIDSRHAPIASGSYGWESRLENGYWTYSLAEVQHGLQASYRELAEAVQAQYGVTLQRTAAIGVSAMMHGYMPLDAAGALLVPMRTWRNRTTADAAQALTALFGHNIPQRWSIAHLYQAILNDEPHVRQIAHITTLSGYIHRQLTGQNVLGIGDASGMFPIDIAAGAYDARMLAQFDELIAAHGYPWRIAQILPAIRVAGNAAGHLSEAGARMLDPSGALQSGIPLAPPEGDAGTGMVATNSVERRTGNVSAGTSIFGMFVLAEPLKSMHPQLDLVTTPDGSLVGMVHANNCTADLDAWIGLFREFADCMGVELDRNAIFEALYQKALEGDPDCGGLLTYGFLSGENIMGLAEGRPLFARTPDSRFTLANFMRAHLYSALGALKTGMDRLRAQEDVKIDHIFAHGGLFKTPGVGQRMLAAALNAPISVMKTAGEGGPWGMALLAAYMRFGEQGETLGAYLAQKVFQAEQGVQVMPRAEDVAGFETFLNRYASGIAIEEAAVAHLH